MVITLRLTTRDSHNAETDRQKFNYDVIINKQGFNQDAETDNQRLIRKLKITIRD